MVVAAKVCDVSSELSFQIQALHSSPGSAPSELRELLSIIEGIEELEIFGRTGDEGFSHLVYWLISRAQQINAEQAVQDLAGYLEIETLSVSFIIGVDGIQLANPMRLGDYELISWGNLQTTDTKWNITKSAHSGSKLPTAVIVRKYEIPKSLIYPWLGLDIRFMDAFEPAHDLIRCVALISGAAIRPLCLWIEPELSTPLAVVWTRLGSDASVIRGNDSIDSSSEEKITQCFTAFDKLGTNQKIRLRLPLDRLNKSRLNKYKPVDSAIDLGIALESLYAPIKLDRKISLTIRERGAKWLGGRPEQCEQTKTVLKSVYELRSLASHAGRFDTQDAKTKWRDFQEVFDTLNKGMNIVAESLIKVVFEGEPNWEELYTPPA
jgi:hypothetical protein